MITTELLLQAYKMDASDVHITVGRPPIFRIHGSLLPIDTPAIRENLSEVMKEDIRPLTPDETDALLRQIMKAEHYEKFMSRGEFDFSYSVSEVLRVRVNAFKQRSSTAFVMRLLSTKIPSI